MNQVSPDECKLPRRNFLRNTILGSLAMSGFSWFSGCEEQAVVKRVTRSFSVKNPNNPILLTKQIPGIAGTIGTVVQLLSRTLTLRQVVLTYLIDQTVGSVVDVLVMNINLACKSCGKESRINVEAESAKVKCSHCQAIGDLQSQSQLLPSRSPQYSPSYSGQQCAGNYQNQSE